MSGILTFYKKNTGYVTVKGLQKQTPYDPPAYVNNAVLTATLYDSDNQPVSGFTDVAGVYIASSNGDYSFSLAGCNFDPPVSPPGVPTYTLKISGTYTGACYEAVRQVIIAEGDGTEP